MRLLIVMTFLVLAGCSRVSIDEYAQTTPPLDLKTFFNGDLVAYGILQDRSGRVTRKFSATIAASWEGEEGTLDEHFIFDDGEEQTRVWTLVHQGNNRYTGTAGDVVGTASGQVAGSAFNWQYTLDVPWNDGTIELNLDDWLYLVEEDHLINRTDLKKFGFKVAELTLVIEKTGS